MRFVFLLQSTSVCHVSGSRVQIIFRLFSLRTKGNGKELMEKVPKHWGNVCCCQDTNQSLWSLLFLNLLHTTRSRLQALVYDILPSTTAVFSYALGSRKLSANKQFFLGAQTVVSLLQTAQIKQGVSFIAANKVCTSTNKTTIVWIVTELFFLPGVDAPHVCVRAWALCGFHSLISTHTPSAVQRRGQRPPKGSGTNMTVEAA